MSLPKYNKFNAGKTKGFFPINKWRCDTSAHPVIISSGKCASSTPKALFSQQEIQMLVGLSNTLQCDEQNAVRIALYEACRSPVKAHEMIFRYASSQSTDKGHQGRSLAKRWRLPKKEQVAAVDAAKSLGITDAEFIRLSIIWLQLGIRKNEIKSVVNCKIVSGDQAGRQWSRENHGRPPSEQISGLKQALQEAQALFDYLDDIKDKERDARDKERMSMTSWTKAAIDQEVSDYRDKQDQWFQDLLEADTLEDAKSGLAYVFLRKWNVDWDTAMLIVEDSFRSKADRKKLKPIERLRLIESGREKANRHEAELKKRRREAEQKRQANDECFYKYRDTLPKTWWAYVNGQRLGLWMIGGSDPFPELPNPLLRDYPKPNDWPSENVSADDGKEPIHYDFEESERSRKESFKYPEIDYKTPPRLRRTLAELLDKVFDTQD